MDVGGVKTAAFSAFETRNGRNEKVTIDSLHKLRQVERESEQAFRNGEGQPLVFRAWANDRSNKDASALHKNFHGGEQPTAEAKRRFGSPQKFTSEPDTKFGPGVNESNASALGDS